MPAEGAAEGGDPVPDRPGEAARIAEEQAWKEIVANFGERAILEDPASDNPELIDSPAEDPPAAARRPTFEATSHDEDEHFVPPPPPPLPTPPPARLLAWIGLFGVPLMVLLSIVTGIRFPSWLGVLLMGWFVGGFVFLVATMRSRDESDGPDHGAVV